MTDYVRLALGTIAAPELRASLCRLSQAIVTRLWPTLPELAPAPVGPSIDTLAISAQPVLCGAKRGDRPQTATYCGDRFQKKCGRSYETT